jgi:hypothetical protein
MHVGNYLGLFHQSQQQLAEACDSIAQHHQDEPDVYAECKLMASWCREGLQPLKSLVDHYGEELSQEPERLRSDLFQGPRTGGLGLLRDLHDLWLMANEAHISWTVLFQAGRALRDRELEQVCQEGLSIADRQIAWLNTRIKQAAPQALVAAQ